MNDPAQRIDTVRVRSARFSNDDELPWSGRHESDRDSFAGIYRQMVVIRRFEEAMQQLFVRGEIHGTTHLCAGQEAVSVGVCAALERQDYVAGTYRGHGHAIAKGVELESLAAELMGRHTGACGGRAGSMNVIAPDRGLIGCFGIVGGSMAAAIGAGLTARRTGRVAVAFFGDGTANQAYFAECLNFAAVFRLPVVFVCENNLYGEYTPMAQVTAGADIAARAAVFSVPAEKLDGNDVRVIHHAARDAVERARPGGGPTFLECMTYRHYGHSRTDPATYRPDNEVARWKARDPLILARDHLIDTLGFSAAEVEAMAAEAKQTVKNAVQIASLAPWPDPTEPIEEYCHA